MPVPVDSLDGFEVLVGCKLPFRQVTDFRRDLFLHDIIQQSCYLYKLRYIPRVYIAEI